MREIYLDNSATTALSEAAKEKIREALEIYGNPSSLHPVGQAAHVLLEEARRSVAATLGVRGNPEPGQLIFTSCGSESDNLALFGTAYAKPRRRGMRILTTDSEHPGVENCMKALEADGFEVIRIPTHGGELDWDFYTRSLNDRVFLVSLMTVNNETGALYDLKRAFALAKSVNPLIVTHTDAVQGYLKCRLNPQNLRADLVTLSGHKIHAPKGVGALYISTDALRRRDVVPVLLGGGQEGGFRSGTENLIGIAAFGAAAKDGFSSLDADLAHMTDLRDYAEQCLQSLPVVINRPTGARAPHILNFILPDIRSETMLHELSRSGICVSNGSACSSHSRNLSRALTSFGLSPDQIECCLRVSFSRFNTRADVDALALALSDAIERLVRIHR